MRSRHRLLAAAALAIAASGVLPASAARPSAPIPISSYTCSFQATTDPTSGGTWTATVTMHAQDADAKQITEECWLQDVSYYTADTGDDVAGSRTTCSTSGSAAPAQADCVASAKFVPPAGNLYYCILATRVTANDDNQSFARCTQRIVSFQNDPVGASVYFTGGARWEPFVSYEAVSTLRRLVNDPGVRSSRVDQIRRSLPEILSPRD